MAEERIFNGFKKVDESLVTLRKVIHKLGEGLTFPCVGTYTSMGDNNKKNYLLPNGKIVSEVYLE